MDEFISMSLLHSQCSCFREILSHMSLVYIAELRGGLVQWYSTFFLRVPPDIISLQLCTPKVVGV
jgi:hypothetical protein